jgi:hypothetical protein
MATIRKRGNSYIVDYRDKDGLRVRKTFDSEYHANKFMLRMDTKVKAQRRYRDFYDNGISRLQCPVCGQRVMI